MTPSAQTACIYAPRCRGASGGRGRRRELVEQRRFAHLQLRKDAALRGRDLATLGEAPGGAPEAPQPQLLKLMAQGEPGALAGGLDDAHEQQGQPAEHDVGAEAIFPAVVDRAQVEDRVDLKPNGM